MSAVTMEHDVPGKVCEDFKPQRGWKISVSQTVCAELAAHSQLNIFLCDAVQVEIQV